MKSKYQYKRNRQPLKSFTLYEKRSDSNPCQYQNDRQDHVPHPYDEGYMIAQVAEQKMKNGAFVESTVEIILNILIACKSTGMILCKKTGQDLRLVTLAILIALVNQYDGIQQDSSY